eukprot:15461747-Alexandrium_andersonii.AAC.1
MLNLAERRAVLGVPGWFIIGRKQLLPRSPHSVRQCGPNPHNQRLRGAPRATRGENGSSPFVTTVHSRHGN